MQVEAWYVDAVEITRKTVGDLAAELKGKKKTEPDTSAGEEMAKQIKVQARPSNFRMRKFRAIRVAARRPGRETTAKRPVVCAPGVRGVSEGFLPLCGDGCKERVDHVFDFYRALCYGRRFRMQRCGQDNASGHIGSSGKSEKSSSRGISKYSPPSSENLRR